MHGPICLLARLVTILHLLASVACLRAAVSRFELVTILHLLASVACLRAAVSRFEQVENPHDFARAGGHIAQGLRGHISRA